MAPWTCRTVHCFPHLMGLMLTLGIIIVLTIAVLRNDVSPYVPFISETGTYPPESGIFSIFLDITVMLGLVTIILRYMIVKECIQDLGHPINNLNKMTVVIGIISMLGMLIVSAYPVNSTPKVHHSGALILFLCSLVYGISHTWISYKMYPTHECICICRTRLFLTVLSTLSFIVMITCGEIGRKRWDEVLPGKWKGKKVPGDEGFVLLVVSAVSEWVITAVFIAYYFTFVREFSKVRIQLNVRKLVPHSYDMAQPNEGNSNDINTP